MPVRHSPQWMQVCSSGVIGASSPSNHDGRLAAGGGGWARARGRSRAQHSSAGCRTAAPRGGYRPEAFTAFVAAILRLLRAGRYPDGVPAIHWIGGIVMKRWNWGLLAVLVLAAPVHAAQAALPAAAGECIAQFGAMRDRPWLGVEIETDSLDRCAHRAHGRARRPAEKAGSSPETGSSSWGGVDPKLWFAGKAGWKRGWKDGDAAAITAAGATTRSSPWARALPRNARQIIAYTCWRRIWPWPARPTVIAAASPSFPATLPAGLAREPQLRVHAAQLEELSRA